jgi:hypothetical protein
MGRPPKNNPTATPAPVRIEVDENLVRQIEEEDEANFLFVPPEVIPDGMRYEWKTYSVLGQVQPRRIGRFERRGWTPVPAERHPGLFTPKGYTGNIEYDGLILMERAEELCRLVEEKDFGRAREQVRGKEAQLGGGDIDGIGFDTKHRSAQRVSGVKKSYEPFKVPEE